MTRATIKNISLPHGLLFGGMLLLGLNYLVYSAFGFDALRLPVRVMGMALLALSAMLNFRKLRFDFLYVPMLGIAAICVLMHGTDALNMLAVLLFVLAASPYDLRAVIGNLIGCFAICTCLYLAALASGGISSVSYVMEGRTRNTLGFTNVNAASLYFLPLLLALFRKNRHTVITASLVMLVFVGIYLLTNTRSALITVGAFFAARVLFSAMAIRKSPAFIRSVVGIVVLCGLVASAFAIPLLAGSDLDYVLSYRPTLFRDALKDFTPADWLLGSASFAEVDNSFIVMVGHYGLIFFVCAFCVLAKAIKRVSFAEDPWSFSFIIALVACGSVESFLYRPELIATLAFWLIAFNESVKTPSPYERGERRHA